MRLKNSMFFLWIPALSALLLASLAHADITKCIDQAGRITYSDGQCIDAVSTQSIEIDIAPALSPTPATIRSLRSVSPMALQNLRERTTPWATMPVVARQGSKDFATVSDARNAMLAMDRGLAAMRTQKLVSSR